MERLPRRRGYDERRAGRGHGVQRLAPRLRLHHHAGAAAVGGVVDRAVPVVGPVAQVVHVQVEQPAGARLAGQRELERAQVVGEDRDDVDPHVGSPSSRAGSSRPGRSATTIRRARQVDRRHQRGHERHQHLAPVTGVDHQQVLAGVVEHLGDHPDPGAGGVLDVEADQLVVVELLGVLRHLVRRQVDVQQRAAGGLRGRCGRRARRTAPAAGPGAGGCRRWSGSTGRPGCLLRGVSTAPTTKRRSGSSLRTSTDTSPRTPCALPIRPTQTSISLTGEVFQCRAGNV